MKHARKSPSSSARWTICHASVSREAQLARAARESSAAADSGTIVHDLAEGGLTKGNDYIAERKGTRATVTDDGTVLYAPASSSFLPGGHEVDDEMVDCATKYVTFVTALALTGDLFVEQRVSIEHITGEPDAKGTADAVICYPDELCVIDLKSGYQRVMASYPFEGLLYEYGPTEFRLTETRFPNTQAVMYAEAVRKERAQSYDFKRVRIIIVQPRLNHIDEHVIPIEEFETWVNWIREQSLACTLPSARVVPDESTCRWCKVFPCPEAQRLALSTALTEFDEAQTPPDDALDLGRAKRLVPLIRMYCDAVDARVLAELNAGREVNGWKLVDGDQGDRQWSAPAAVELELQLAGLEPDDYLTRKLKSPAQVEKMRLPVWAALTPLITRAPASPKVAPDTDPRPARVIDPLEGFL